MQGCTAGSPQHKLILSVTGDICVRENNFFGGTAISSGPMYCAMRSARHSSSSPYYQFLYMKRIQSFDTFDDNFFL